MSSLAAEIAALGDIQERAINQDAISQKGPRLVSIRFERIREFEGHPFRLYSGERLTDMVESIRQNGILMPLIVRRIFGDALGGDYDLTGRQVANYLRINRLMGCLRLKLDDKLLTLTTAVALSYLCQEDQLAVYAAMKRYPRKLSDTQAAGLQELAKAGPLTEQSVVDFLRTPKHPAPAGVSINRAVYALYFAPGTSKKEVERVIGEALALYFSQTRGESA